MGLRCLWRFTQRLMPMLLTHTLFSTVFVLNIRKRIFRMFFFLSQTRDVSRVVIHKERSFKKISDFCFGEKIMELRKAVDNLCIYDPEFQAYADKFASDIGGSCAVQAVSSRDELIVAVNGFTSVKFL